MKHLKLFEDSDNVNDRIFISLLRNNESEKAFEFLKNNDIDPAMETNLAIKTAVSEGNIEFVKYLLADKRVDPTVGHNSPIMIASMYGNVEMVKLLLTDERVDPVDDYYYQCAFDEACKYDQLEIIKILMEDDRVKQRVSNTPYHKLDGVIKGLLMDELEIDSEEELKIIFNMM